MSNKGIEVDGLAEFHRTADAAIRQLDDLDDAHRAAGEVLVNQPQPRTPSIAEDVRYTVHGGATLLTGNVIYDAHIDYTTDDRNDRIIEIFEDEIERVVSTIHGT